MPRHTFAEQVQIAEHLKKNKDRILAMEVTQQTLADELSEILDTPISRHTIGRIAGSLGIRFSPGAGRHLAAVRSHEVDQADPACLSRIEAKMDAILKALDVEVPHG